MSLKSTFLAFKKVVKVVQIGGRGGRGNLDKIQKNSYFFFVKPSLTCFTPKKSTEGGTIFSSPVSETIINVGYFVHQNASSHQKRRLQEVKYISLFFMIWVKMLITMYPTKAGCRKQLNFSSERKSYTNRENRISFGKEMVDNFS